MEPKVCLALGGGAARGLAHLGVLKILGDAGIRIHLISGTSVGALVGGLYASRPDAAYWMERVEQFLRSFRSRKTRLEFIRRLEQPANNRHGFFADMANLVRKGFFWGVAATKPAFISEEEYREFVYPLIPDIAIEDTAIPFGCVAVDIQSGRRVVYTSGSLRTAISASCSLPGIFPPVKDKGMLLVDGGWLERVPVRCGREMGADIVIGVNVSSDLAGFESRSGLDILLRADAVTRVYLNDIILREADLIVRPEVGHIHWADFNRPRELFRLGEHAALGQLSAIKLRIHKAAAPEKGIARRIKTIRDRIIGTVKGKPGGES